MKLSLKVPLRNAGFNGKLLAHMMCWFGETKTGDPTKVHRVTSYSSTDPLAIAAQLRNCQALGIEGVICTWFGAKVSASIHAACREICRQCAERKMLFALLLDPWICAADPTPVGKAGLVIASLKDPTTQEMLNSPAYIPEKAVLDFSTNADWATVQAAGFKVWRRGTEYGWPNINNTIHNLVVQHSNPLMQAPCICSQFFDGGRLDTSKGDGLNGYGRNYEGSVWAPPQSPPVASRRVIDHQAGNFYLDTVDTLKSCLQAPYALIVTLNDDDEGTGIQHFFPMLTGDRIKS